MTAGILTSGLDRPLSGITRYTPELARALHRDAGTQLLVLAAGSAPSGSLIRLGKGGEEASQLYCGGCTKDGGIRGWASWV